MADDRDDSDDWVRGKVSYYSENSDRLYINLQGKDEDVCFDKAKETVETLQLMERRENSTEYPIKVKLVPGRPTEVLKVKRA